MRAHADRLELSARDALTVRRIVKVNHAGEYGAIRIYAAQIAVARRLCPEELPALVEMRARKAALRRLCRRDAGAAVAILPGDVPVELGRLAARLPDGASRQARNLGVYRSRGGDGPPSPR